MLSELKSVLTPACNIRAVKEAQSIYDAISENCKDKAEALINWDHAVLDQINNAHTVEDCRNLSYHVHIYSKDIKSMIHERWNKITLIDLKQARTFKDGIEVFISPVRPESLEEALCKRFISLAKTVEEVEDFYWQIPSDGVIGKAILRKWIDLASTIPELEKIHDATMEGSEDRDLVDKKLASLK